MDDLHKEQLSPARVLKETKINTSEFEDRYTNSHKDVLMAITGHGVLGSALRKDMAIGLYKLLDNRDSLSVDRIIAESQRETESYKRFTKRFVDYSFKSKSNSDIEQDIEDGPNATSYICRDAQLSKNFFNLDLVTKLIIDHLGVNTPFSVNGEFSVVFNKRAAIFSYTQSDGMFLTKVGHSSGSEDISVTYEHSHEELTTSLTSAFLTGTHLRKHIRSIAEITGYSYLEYIKKTYESVDVFHALHRSAEEALAKSIEDYITARSTLEAYVATTTPHEVGRNNTPLEYGAINTSIRMRVDLSDYLSLFDGEMITAHDQATDDLKLLSTIYVTVRKLSALEFKVTKVEVVVGCLDDKVVFKTTSVDAYGLSSAFKNMDNRITDLLEKIDNPEMSAMCVAERVGSWNHHEVYLSVVKFEMFNKLHMAIDKKTQATYEALRKLQS